MDGDHNDDDNENSYLSAFSYQHHGDNTFEYINNNNNNVIVIMKIRMSIYKY